MLIKHGWSSKWDMLLSGYGETMNRWDPWIRLRSLLTWTTVGCFFRLMDVVVVIGGKMVNHDGSKLVSHRGVFQNRVLDSKWFPKTRPIWDSFFGVFISTWTRKPRCCMVHQHLGIIRNKAFENRCGRFPNFVLHSRVRSPPSGSLSWMSWVKLRRPYSQWNTRKVTDTGKGICRMHPTYAINTLEPPLGHASPYVLNTLSVMRCRFRSKWCLSGIGGSRNAWKLKITLPKKEFQLNFQESFFQVLASILGFVPFGNHHVFNFHVASVWGVFISHLSGRRGETWNWFF